MVFVNLSKLILLIQAVQACPKGIPNRYKKLFQDYEFFVPTSDDVVSVAVDARLERMKESNVDEEELPAWRVSLMLIVYWSPPRP